jgi:hypothetical protein
VETLCRARVSRRRFLAVFFMIAPSTKGWRIAGYLVLFKVAYLVLLSTALCLWPRGQVEAIFYCTHGNHTPDGHLPFASHFVSNDAQFFLFISHAGYKHGDRTCGSYPLYPLLIRWGSALTGGHDILTGVVLSNLFSLVAFLLFFQMTARRYGDAVAALALGLLLVFPGSLFFQFIYSESVFFLLLMLFCFGLEREHLGLALVAGFLLPLTRAVGIFCVFPLVWHLFFRSPPAWWVSLAGQQDWAGRIARVVQPRGDDLPVTNSRGWAGARAVGLVLAPFFGWAAYFLLMQQSTGDAFEGIKAQKVFRVQSIGHLYDLPRFVKEFFNITQWHGYTGSLLDRCSFILLIDCFPLLWKLNKQWCLWAFFIGVVPAVSGGFTSETRFVSVVFPLFIALGVLLSKPAMNWWRWGVLTIFAAIHLVLVWRFVNFDFA